MNKSKLGLLAHITNNVTMFSGMEYYHSSQETGRVPDFEEEEVKTEFEMEEKAPPVSIPPILQDPEHTEFDRWVTCHQKAYRSMPGLTFIILYYFICKYRQIVGT